MTLKPAAWMCPTCDDMCDAKIAHTDRYGSVCDGVHAPLFTRDDLVRVARWMAEDLYKGFGVDAAPSSLDMLAEEQVDEMLGEVEG